MQTRQELSAAAKETSLADLVQANALGANTCRILVTSPQGRGVLYLQEGDVVDAAYGDLVGEEAFCALLNAADARFQVSSGLTTSVRRIGATWQALVANAMTLRFEGRLPVPRFPEGNTEPQSIPDVVEGELTLVPPLPGLADQMAPEPKAAAARAAPTRPPRARPEPAKRRAETAARPKSKTGLVAAAVVGFVALVGGAFLAIALSRQTPGSEPPSQTRQPEKVPAAAPIEVSELTGPADAQPKLLVGTPPRSPDPSSAILPTIVCRILIDENGSVKEAQVFRSRLDLATFEDAAIVAVKAFKFSPGRHAGRPVPVWLNWPVAFQ